MILNKYLNKTKYNRTQQTKVIVQYSENLALVLITNTYISY